MDVLTYICDNGAEFTSEQLTQLLQFAGTDTDLSDKDEQYDWAACGSTGLSAPRPDCATLLRERGAAWPDVLGYEGVDDAGPYRYSWNEAMLHWARTEGCTSLLIKDVNPLPQ